MVTFIVRRLLIGVLTLFIVSIGCFVLVDLPPGDALTAHIQDLTSQGRVVSQAEIESWKERFGVDKPLVERYFTWATNFVSGDLGYSFTRNQNVNELIWGRLGFSLALALGALVIAWGLAIPIGVYSATHRYSMPDNIITLIQFTGVAVPEFLLALAVMIFAVRVLGIDVGGIFSPEFETAPWSFAKFMDFLGHLWMPLFVIATGSTAWLSRVMRANLMDVLNQQYIQTARAKGVLERKVIWKHATRNAMHPLVMALGMTLPTLLGGEVIVSIVLDLPTIGPMLLDALRSQDMHLAVSVLVLSAILLIIGNIIADILLAWIDPRTRTVD